MQLGLSLGAGVGFEVLVGGDEEAGGAGVDTGVLVVERGGEELGGREGDADGVAAGVDADIFGAEMREIDAGDGLTVDDEEDAVAAEEIGEDGGGAGAFDDGIEGVDDGFEAVEALDFGDDGGDAGVVGAGAAGDEGGEMRGNAGGGVAHEIDDAGGAERDGEEKGEKGTGGGAAGAVLGGHKGLRARCRG